MDLEKIDDHINTRVAKRIRLCEFESYFVEGLVFYDRIVHVGQRLVQLKDYLEPVRGAAAVSRIYALFVLNDIGRKCFAGFRKIWYLKYRYIRHFVSVLLSKRSTPLIGRRWG